MTKPTIDITITAPVACGKSTVAHIIARALQGAGIDVDWPDEDGVASDIETLDQRAAAIAETCAVRVREVQLPRGLAQES